MVEGECLRTREQVSVVKLQYLPLRKGGRGPKGKGALLAVHGTQEWVAPVKAKGQGPKATPTDEEAKARKANRSRASLTKSAAFCLPFLHSNCRRFHSCRLPVPSLLSASGLCTQPSIGSQCHDVSTCTWPSFARMGGSCARV